MEVKTPNHPIFMGPDLLWILANIDLSKKTKKITFNKTDATNKRGMGIKIN